MSGSYQLQLLELFFVLGPLQRGVKIAFCPEIIRLSSMSHSVRRPDARLTFKGKPTFGEATNYANKSNVDSLTPYLKRSEKYFCCRKSPGDASRVVSVRVIPDNKHIMVPFQQTFRLASLISVSPGANSRH